MDRFEELVSEYLDGSLDPEGKAELAALLEADPARRNELVDLLRESRILSAELGEVPSSEFTRRVIAELEKGKSGFVRAVMTDVRGGGTKTTGRALKPFRPEGPGAPVWSMWMAWAAGAAIVLGLLIFALGGGSESPRPSQVRQEKRKELPHPEARIEQPAPPPKPSPPDVPKPPPAIPLKPEPAPVPEPRPTPPAPA